MPEPKLDRRVFLEDVRSGLDKRALMAKYRLDVDKLRTVFDDLVDVGVLEPVGDKYVLPIIRRVNARKLAHDIRSGMNKSQMIAKYVLTLDQLTRIVEMLHQHGSITSQELRSYRASSLDTREANNLRLAKRCYLDFELPIVDTGPPERDGIVRDITEKGVGIVGIPAQVNDVKTFLVLHDEFVLLEPFMFKAKCRWATKREPRGEHFSGFQITRISNKDLAEMRKLIHLVTFYA